MHFSRVKDCVLVAVQRRNAGRASHGILQNKKMREAKTALKSGSSPLALSSFPKLLIAFASAKAYILFVHTLQRSFTAHLRRNEFIAAHRSEIFCPFEEIPCGNLFFIKEYGILLPPDGIDPH